MFYNIYFCIKKAKGVCLWGDGRGIQFIIRGGVVFGLNPQHEICYK